MEDAEESSRMVEAIFRARKELSEKKARELFEWEHTSKREDLQSRLDEAARQLWDYDRIRQGAEERIAGAEALVKVLKAEATVANSDQRETYDQYHKLCQEWRAEEIKSRRKFSGTFHQDWVCEPLKLPDLPPSIRHLKDQKLAEPQRPAAPPPDNAEAARKAVSAWVGSTSERRPTQEARRTPQARGLLAKFVDHSKILGRWKFLSLRELEAEQLEPPAQRAIAEFDRVLDNGLSWRSSFPGLVDISSRTTWGASHKNCIRRFGTFSRILLVRPPEESKRAGATGSATMTDFHRENFRREVRNMISTSKLMRTWL